MNRFIKTISLFVLTCLVLSSCFVQRGNGCYDQRKAVGYGCYKGR